MASAEGFGGAGGVGPAAESGMAGSAGPVRGKDGSGKDVCRQGRLGHGRLRQGCLRRHRLLVRGTAECRHGTQQVAERTCVRAGLERRRDATKHTLDADRVYERGEQENDPGEDAAGHPAGDQIAGAEQDAGAGDDDEDGDG